MAGIISFKIIIVHLIMAVITINIAIVAIAIQIRILIAAIGLAHIELNISMMHLIGNYHLPLTFGLSSLQLPSSPKSKFYILLQLNSEYKIIS